MADPDSEDEDSTFVTIGTPLETFEDDEVLKKPIALHEQTVKDQQGRQRFHGAFTGGFSAGFFNTVGTLEGWTPSTFVSSRGKKAEKTSQRPEDFMDDDDFTEHGIAPRQISTTESFTSTKKRQQQSTSSGSIIPGDLAALRNLIIPARLTIGVKLLRGLGWKEGQGIGPRVKRKVKRKVKAPSDKKIYGCALPTAQEEEDSSSEDEYAEGLTFAPKDSNPIPFTPKHNTHGIGYSGIDTSQHFGGSSAVSLFKQPVVTKSGRKGITGTAFGVGALEEDDGDIYSNDSMSNYDRVLGGEEEDNFHGWTAPTERRKKKSRFGPPTTVSHVEQVLQGFSLASSSLKPNKVYPPPRVPRDYRPVHHFKVSDIIQGQTQGQGSTSGSRLDAAARAVMLGEVGSVFDLVSKSDKEKMVSAKEAPKTVPYPTEPLPQKEKVQLHFAPQKSGLQKPPSQSTEDEKPAEKSSEPTSSENRQPLFKGALGGFKPFSKEPAKQERYEKFVELKKQGRKDEITALQENMTEWERAREREEFERAAQLYKPMSLLMASRFHHAQYDDDKTDGVSLEEPKKVLTDAEQAASCKMFGKLTRESYEWHPDRILCKRFNIPNPYPSSTIVGLPGTKRDKFTVFDFLTIPAQAEPPPPPPDVTLASVAAAKQQKTKKPGPLAILNTPSSAQPVFKPSASASSEQEPMEVQDDQSMKISSDQEEKDHSIEKLPTKPSEGLRLPMDLFKAIFDDSDSSDESSSDEGEKAEGKSSKKDTESENDEEPVRQKNETSSESSSDDKSPSRSPASLNQTTSLGQNPPKPVTQPGQGQPKVKPLGNRKNTGVFSMINEQIEQARANVDQSEKSNLMSKGLDVTVAKSGSPSLGSINDTYGPLPPGGATGHQPPGSAPGDVNNDDEDVYGPQPLSKSSVQDSSSKLKITSTDKSLVHKLDSPALLSERPTREKDRSSSHKKHKHKHKDRRKDSRNDKDESRSADRDSKKDRRREKRDRDRSHDRSRERDRSRDREMDSGGDRVRSTEGDRNVIKDKHRKKEDRHRDRSPVWVETNVDNSKNKKKKSKHKKHKSKKSKKKKKSKRKESDSGESADTESDSDDDSVDVPTNSQILQRLMMLKKP